MASQKITILSSTGSGTIEQKANCSSFGVAYHGTEEKKINGIFSCDDNSDNKVGYSYEKCVVHPVKPLPECGVPNPTFINDNISTPGGQFLTVDSKRTYITDDQLKLIYSFAEKKAKNNLFDDDTDTDDNDGGWTFHINNKRIFLTNSEINLILFRKKKINYTPPTKKKNKQEEEFKKFVDRVFEEEPEEYFEVPNDDDDDYEDDVEYEDDFPVGGSRYKKCGQCGLNLSRGEGKKNQCLCESDDFVYE